MANLDYYISRIEETCGEEHHYIIFLKYERSKEAIEKILKRTKLERSIASIIYEVKFNDILLRVYSSGKILMQNIKDKETLMKILSDLLL